MSKRKDPPAVSYSTPSSGPVTDGCADLSFTDDLGSVQPVALSAEPGTKFAVKLVDNLPQVYTYKGELCGRVVHLLSMKLVDCLRKGHPFRAVVLDKKPHVCHVLIESDQQ